MKIPNHGIQTVMLLSILTSAWEKFNLEEEQDQCLKLFITTITIVFHSFKINLVCLSLSNQNLLNLAFSTPIVSVSSTVSTTVQEK